MTLKETREYINQQAMPAAPLTLEAIYQLVGRSLSSVIGEAWQLALFDIAVLPYFAEFEAVYVTKSGLIRVVSQPHSALHGEWEHALRRLYLLTEADKPARWNRVELVFEAGVVSADPSSTRKNDDKGFPPASLREATLHWDRDQEALGELLVHLEDLPPGPHRRAWRQELAQRQEFQVYSPIY